jgi:hypothetical protein
MSKLFEQKCLRHYRLLNKYYLIAVDATGIVSFDKPYCEHCLTRKSKEGKMTYFHYVLEAKFVTSDGLALSLVSEWIKNPAGKFDKQEENSLKTVHEELVLIKKRSPQAGYYTIKEDWRITYEFRFHTGIDYHQKYTLNWVQ